ncbi:MAG TPA: NAD(P)H-dependent oxidoreductase [Myxococcaceae bacterium]|jgi:putative NADPH-quinone reductase
MHALIVFDHPYGPAAGDNEPHHRSLSAAMLKAVVAGLDEASHTHDLLDLAAEGFDPVMTADELRHRRTQGTPPADVAAIQQRLAQADHLILIFPTWWMAMPAGTKGFLDRVLTEGFAYAEPVPGRPLVRLLHRLQEVSVLTAMTSPGWAYRWWFGRPAQQILACGTFRLIGIPKVRWYPIYRSVKRGADSRERELARVQRRFASIPLGASAVRPVRLGSCPR